MLILSNVTKGYNGYAIHLKEYAWVLLVSW